jgi:hypothetical protein
VKQHGSVLSSAERSTLLRFTRQPASRQFYSLPKTHKERTKWNGGFPPLRPICPDIGTETSMSGKFIATYLAPFVEKIGTYIPNSFVLANRLQTLRNLPSTAVWLVADVDQLYPSIPIKEAYDTVRTIVHANQAPGTDNTLASLILDLLSVHLHYNFLEFEGACWLQQAGIPMGKAWAPAVACLYMDIWDRNLLQRIPTKPLLLVRYTDDLLFIFPNREAAEDTVHIMNHINPNIKITEYTTATSVHFLDLKLDLVHFQPSLRLILPFTPTENELVVRISLYRKPSDLIAILHCESAHTWQLKMNTILSQCLRITRLSNDPISAGRNVFTLLAVMKHFRALPSRSLRRIRSKVIVSFVRTQLLKAHHVRTGTVYTGPVRNLRHRCLLSLPTNINHSLFKKTIMTLYDTLSPRERNSVGHCSTINQCQPKLLNLLFK